MITRRSSTTAVLALLTLCALPTNARAGVVAPEVVVVVVPAPLSDDAREGLGGRANAHVEIAPEPAPRASSREIVEAARESYTSMDFDAALANAREAVVSIEAQAESRADFAHLADAWLLRGMAELALGHEPEAEAAFRQAVVLLPGRELDESDYPPPVRASYGNVRRAIRTAPEALREVRVTPARAQLFLDGVEVGVGTATLRGTPGRHQLRIVAPGFRTQRLSVELNEGGGEAVELTLVRAERGQVIAELASLTGVIDPDARETLLTVIGADIAIAIAPAEGSVSFVAVSRAEARRGRAPNVAAALRSALPAEASSDELNPEGTTGPTTEPLHEGFYARLWAGLALRGDGVSANEVTANAAVPAGDIEIGAGFSIVPGLLVGGSLFFSIGSADLNVACPATVTDPGCNTALPQSSFVAALKLFVNWYPFVSGFHFGGGVGLARLQLKDGFALLPDTTTIGGMIDVHAGYDFWVTDFATLGAALRLAGWRGQRDGVVLSGGAISLLATLAYD